MQYELGIIGAGQMAEAILRGLLRAGLYRPNQVIAADVADVRRKLFADELEVAVTTDNADVARQSKIILLSVKPYQMAEVLGGIGAAMPEGSLVVSIAAGILSASIEKHLGGGKAWRVVRAMPNTPMLVGEGMVAVSAGAYATAGDLAAARRVFEASADVIDVREEQMDAVTAVSGSGPAYFFYFVEAMIRAGVEAGLTEDQVRRLAAKTCVGAGKMLLTSVDAPAELRRKVTTPNGTTHAAVTTMEARGVGEAVAEGVHAAARRSKELGQ